jgi:hypothetical protein
MAIVSFIVNLYNPIMKKLTESIEQCFHGSIVIYPKF